MSRKKQETKVLCPGCGTEFAIADKEFAATGTVIGILANHRGYHHVRALGIQFGKQLPKGRGSVSRHSAVPVWT